MRKTLPLLLLLVLIPFAYHGFKELIHPTMTKVGVSRSTGFGQVNPDFFAVFEDRPALNLFRRVVSRAIKLPGIVDVAHPDYDAEIRYSNGRTTGLHLWLHPKGTAASIMYVDDTHTMYRVPEDIAGELFKRLKPYAEQPANERSGPVGEEPSALPSEDPDASGSVPEYRGAGVFFLRQTN